MKDGHKLRDIVLDAYGQLEKHKLVKNQFEFSRQFLRKSNGYYAYIKCSGVDVNVEAVLALWAECRRQKISWKKAAIRPGGNNFSKAVFERMAIKTEQLERQVSEAVMELYLQT